MITVPTTLSTSASGGVTIQKTVVTTSLQAAKTISLPYGSTPLLTPKTIGTNLPTSGIPVARVIPQLSGTSITATGAPDPANPGTPSGLYITRPLVQQMQLSSDNSLIVTSIPSSEAGNAAVLSNSTKHLASLTPIGPKTPQKQAHARADVTMEPTNLTMSPSRPGILRRRGEGERELTLEALPPSVQQVLSSHSQPNRPDRRDGGPSSGSTTLSATSSPCDAANLSGEELGPAQILPSPRKKPRKQQVKNKMFYLIDGY